MVRRWRELKHRPFVLRSWPFSSCLELYVLLKGFQSSEDRNCCTDGI
jgi:hypothetical protein